VFIAVMVLPANPRYMVFDADADRKLEEVPSLTQYKTLGAV